MSKGGIKLMVIVILLAISFALATAEAIYSSGWSCEEVTCQCITERCYYPHQEGKLASKGEKIDLGILGTDVKKIESLPPPPKQEWWLVEGPRGDDVIGLITPIKAYSAEEAKEQYKKLAQQAVPEEVAVSSVSLAQIGVPTSDVKGEFILDEDGNKIYAPQETRTGEKWYVSPSQPQWAWDPSAGKWVPSSEMPAAVVLEEGSAEPKPVAQSGAAAPKPSSSASSVSKPVTKGTVGVKVQDSSAVYEGCRNKRFGLVGASNTVDKDPVGSKVKDSMREILEQSCPDSKVFLNAKGGFGPKAQKSLLSALLSSHSNLDYVVLDVSVNQIRESSLQEYADDVIELAKMVKDKNTDTKVVILAPTPFKGPNYWSQDQQDKQDAFNQNLLNNKLGVPHLINYAVDTYSALEDPPGSDSCGKYCKQDNLHFYDGTGRKQVIATMLNTVFGSSSSQSSASASTVVTNTPVSPTSSTAAENCLNSVRCEEIDKVWLKIVQWISAARKGQIFDAVRGWRPFQEVKPTVVITPAVPLPTVPSATANLCVASYGTAEQKALLDTIAWAEGTKERYNMMFGGKLFNNYASHPVETGEMPPKGFPWSGGTSTAAGRYQFLYSTFKDLKKENYFQTGFNPAEQDKAGLYLVQTKRQLSQPELVEAINSGNYQFVWDKLAREWASLPYSPKGGSSFYPGQGAKKSDDLKNIFSTCLQFHKGGVPSFPSSPSSVGGAVYLQNNILEKACTKESLLCVIPPQNLGKQEAPGIGGCRPGMAQVGNFCIDQYEAMLVERNTGSAWSPYCNPGNQISNLKAVSVVGIIPQTTINQLQAKQACENAGKRLCTSQEFLSACQGNEGRKYPYGNELKVGACNDQHVSRSEHVNQQTVREYCPNFNNYKKVGWNENPWQIHPKNNQLDNSLDATGSNPQCKTPEGVYDLVGNIEDWVADSDGIFRGGFYLRSEGKSVGGCTYRTTDHTTDYYDYSLGFRCCSSLTS